MMIDKIISGGMNRVETAALDLAIKLSIPYAGFRPGIEVPDQSAVTERYRMAILNSNQPEDAIEANVRQANGTFILSFGRPDQHADHARRMTLKNRRHLLGIDLKQHTSFETAGLLASWLDMNHISSVYVTGGSLKKGRDIYLHTMNILESALITLLAGKSLPHTRKNRLQIDANDVLRHTATVKEAVKLLMATLTLRNKAAIAAGNSETLCSTDNDLNRYIQKVFHLREGNETLLKSCAKVARKKDLSSAEASGVIIHAFWEALQKTHRLRIIK
jgi:hypothetical protein